MPALIDIYGFAHKLIYFKNTYVYKMDQCPNARAPRARIGLGTWWGNCCDLDKLEHFHLPDGRRCRRVAGVPTNLQILKKLHFILIYGQSRYLLFVERMFPARS